MGPSFRAILIEDEKLARNRLKDLLKDHQEHVEIIAECGNGTEGLKAINELRPDLIFLDIAMPGLNAFEMLKQLEHIPLIIFTTAYDQYAIKAFEENSVDYLLKPIEIPRLKKSIEKLLRIKPASPENLQAIYDLAEKIKVKKDISFIPVKVGNKIKLIRLDNIIIFEAKEKFVFIINDKGEEYPITTTLLQLEEKLPEQFIRVHRSFIVNKQHIHELKKDVYGGYILIMDDPSEMQVQTGANYQESIKKLLEF